MNQIGKEVKLELDHDSDKKITRNKDYLSWSLINMLFCCICAALPAFNSSIKVREYNLIDPSHLNGARFSKRAFKLNLIATLLGITFFILLLLANFYLP